MATPGRNDPCPCGSGRKFKHCHLQQEHLEDSARVRVRRAEGRIVDETLAFALEQFGKPLFEHAWLDFFLDEPPDADEFTDIPEFDSMFLPWFATSFVRDPHQEDIRATWPDEPLARHWMTVTGPSLDDVETAWIEAAVRSPMSAFAIERLEAGVSLDIRDLLTGNVFHVLELTASRSLRRGDLIFTRVVTAGGVSLMFGMAPLSFPADWQLMILDWRGHVFRRRTPTRDDLAEFDIEIRDLYLDLAERARNPAPPQLCNTDGDPLELTTVSFDLGLPVAEAYDRLESLAMLAEERHVPELDRDDAGVVRRAVLNWVKAGNRKNKAWDNTILGTLRLSPGQLTAEVNSARRADRVIREIRKRLGAAAVLVSRDATSADEIVESARRGVRRKSEPANAAPSRSPEPARSPEIDAIEDGLFADHLESWIDTRVPALGNRTPRQASRTARGRERLEALLAAFGNASAGGREARRQALVNLRKALGLRPD